MTKNTRNSIQAMINRGDTLVQIINYLFTCDYSENQIIKMLTGREFKCKREILIDTFVVDFGYDSIEEATE